MHAVRLHAFGPPDNLQYEVVPDPGPGEGRVGIAVQAGGVVQHFALARVADAHAALEARATTGKVVLVPAGVSR